MTTYYYDPEEYAAELQIYGNKKNAREAGDIVICTIDAFEEGEKPCEIVGIEGTSYKMEVDMFGAAIVPLRHIKFMEEDNGTK